MKKPQNYVAAFLLFVLLFIIGYLISINKKVSHTKLADAVIFKCKSASVKDVCFEDEISKLAKKITMEEAFYITSLIQEKESSFPYCHVLGHKLASIETKKDPSKWKEVVARCPRGSCSNGCVHGAFQERYKNEVLTPTEFDSSVNEFKNICEESETGKMTGLEQGSCYHALGHLLMYITSADIDKSIATCDQISIKDDGRNYSNVCYAGAFMQIFQPLDTDDRSLVSKFVINSGNAWEFCSKYKGLQKTKCREESWPLFLDQISTASGLVNFCSVLDSKGKESCMTNLLYLMPIQFRFEMNNIKKYCSGFDQSYQGLCYAMTASRILEIDKHNIKRTTDFCNSLDENNRSACFDQVLKDSSFDFPTSSQEYIELCNLMPEPWKDKCLQNENK